MINNNDSKRYKPRGGHRGDCDEPVAKGLKGDGAPSPKIFAISSTAASDDQMGHISATTARNFMNAVSTGRVNRGECTSEKARGATAKRGRYAGKRPGGGERKDSRATTAGAIDTKQRGLVDDLLASLAQKEPHQSKHPTSRYSQDCLADL